MSRFLTALNAPFRRLSETPFLRRMLIIFAVIGPGIITASVDNDAGGITTYSIAGAEYGYTMLWTLLPIGIILIIVQELVSRMGVVTGKGLADLIRESYGVKVAFFILLAFFFANLGVVMSNFAGVASSLEIFGVSRFISVPLAVMLVWVLVNRGTSKIVERIFLTASFLFITYIISGFLADPNWGEVGQAIVRPSLSLDPKFIILLLGMVGTTVTPWMQFYLQSAIVQKGVKVEDIKLARWDTVIGGILTTIIAFFIILAAGATLFKHGIHIENAKDAAFALVPFAGRFAEILFAVGLLNASLFAATVVPLSTTYSICEGMGWEFGIGKSWREAPFFKTIFTLVIVIGAIPILFPGSPLIKIMLYAQVVNGILLAPILIYMVRLINKGWLMGEHKNGLIMNILSWVSVVVLIGLSAGFLVTLL